MGIITSKLSFFISNFIYLISFYLGCVIFVYSEKKDRQAVVASISFLCCTLFFVGHLLILGKGIPFILSFSSQIIYPSFIILILLPFVWSYIVFQFYEDKMIWKKVSLRTILLFLEFLFFIISFSITLTLIPKTANAKVSDVIFFIPDEVFYVFSVYIIFCTLGSIYYLSTIERKDNNLEQIAKSSAYQTIYRASILLASLALLVGVAVFFGKNTIENEIRNIETEKFPPLLLILDLVACISVLITILIVGKAVISYQVFTGRYISMKSLKSYWRYILLFGFLYSSFATIGGLFGYASDSKQVILSLLGLVFFVKIQTISRSREEENRKILKPFLFNENLYESIIHSGEKIDFHLENTFRLLCDTTLDTTLACLVPRGAYISYIPKPLFFPEENKNITEKLISFTENIPSNNVIFYLDRDLFEGYILALSIRDKQGLVGVLFLGVKKDYTLYSEEEIEIAKIGSGKILDLLSVTEISRLLVNLQKKQLMDSKLLDHQTRRVLHDDILPEIHTLMIEIDSLKNETLRSNLLEGLSGLHKKISNLLKILPIHPANLNGFNFMDEIGNLAKSELSGQSISYTINPNAKEKLQDLEPVALEVIYYAVRELFRNILRYAISADRKLEVKVTLSFENSILELSIEDNGKGIQPENKVGTGQGLLLHSTMMAVIGGALIRESYLGEFTRVRLVLKKFFL